MSERRCVYDRLSYTNTKGEQVTFRAPCIYRSEYIKCLGKYCERRKSIEDDSFIQFESEADDE
jgi:hypothetical protein